VQLVAAMGQPMGNNPITQNVWRTRGAMLLDDIGPAILITHGDGAVFAWVTAEARPDLVQLLHKVRQPFNVTSLAQAGVIAGMDDAEHVRRTLANNAEGVGYLEREFKRLGLAYVPSHANFILTDVGDGNAVFNRLLKLGVIVRPMGAYGWPKHVRISVGLPEENRKLVEGLERIEKTPS